MKHHQECSGSDFKRRRPVSDPTETIGKPANSPFGDTAIDNSADEFRMGSMTALSKYTLSRFSCSIASDGTRGADWFVCFLRSNNMRLGGNNVQVCEAVEAIVCQLPVNDRSCVLL